MAWNVFKFCTALRALGSIMIVFVLAVIGVTYYVVVVAHYGPSLFLGGSYTLSAIVVLFLFHFLLVMIIWSYSSVVLTDPGGVPPNWRPLRDEEKGDADPLVGSGYGSAELGSNQSAVPGDFTNQDIRFCHKCNQFKPPRAHHCSVCKRCILKMDHHCVWVVNCVGALNYKYFLLFLFYTFLGTTLVSLSLLRVLIDFFNDGEIDETPGTLAATFVTLVLNIAFALSILGFLIMHITLVRANTTTIEVMSCIIMFPLVAHIISKGQIFVLLNFICRHMRRKALLSGVMTLVGRKILNRCLEQTRSSGSSQPIQRRIYDEFHPFRVWNIQQGQTGSHPSSIN